MDVWVAILTAAATLLFVFYRWSNIKACYPPGPRGIPLLGYLPFLGSNPAEKYRQLSKRYGPIMTMKIGPQSMVVLNDYDVIHEALVQMSEKFSGRPTNKIIEMISGGYGIILKNFDSDFAMHRKFCLSVMRGYGFGKRSMELKVIDEIDHLSEAIKSQGHEPLDCQALVSKAVSNVICNIILGSRFSYDDNNFKAIIENVNAGFSSKLESFYFNLLMIAPGLRFFPPFSYVLRRIMRKTDHFAGIVRDILEDHKKTLDPLNPRDFVDEYALEIERRKHEKSTIFCDIQLLMVVRNLFVAGTETSSSTVRWAILLFAHRPAIQRKFYEEVEKQIGSATPSMQHRDSMHYVNAFIQELMRHRTLVPLSVPHTTTEDTTFHGYYIPKGQTVLPNLWAVHHDPTYFEHPQEFKPERFLNSNGEFTKDKRVVPFSLGLRSCLGEQLARMEIFLFLTRLIQRFEISADPCKPLPSFDDGVYGFAYVPDKFSVIFKPR